MPPITVDLAVLPFVPGEQYEVYAVLLTVLLTMVILYFFGQYWQK